jgi:hypothetical protein
MATGIVIRRDPAATNAIDDAVSQASGAFRRGVRQVWIGQPFGIGALTLATSRSWHARASLTLPT